MQTEPIVRAEHLTKAIHTNGLNVPILRDISFTVPQSSLFAITGPSGSGKTTLLNMLTGIDRPTSGKIYFANTEIRGKNEDALSRWRGKHVGIVFQFFQLIPTLTAKENILLALELGKSGAFPRRKWNQRADELLELTGIAEQKHKLPSQMSGGQQQRTAIARALANDPPLLVADEPTGNLDSHAAEAIFALFQQLQHHGKTIIYVTHDRILAQRSDFMLGLLDGEIAENTQSAPEGANQQ